MNNLSIGQRRPSRSQPEVKEEMTAPKRKKRLEVKVKRPPKRNSPGEVDTGAVAPARKRAEARMTERMSRVSRLYLQGMTYGEIAKEVGVSPTTVGNDMEAVREGWLESALMDFDKRKAQEMAKLDRLEQRAWEAFERSIGEMTVRKVKEDRAQPPPGKRGGRPTKDKDKWVPTSQTEEVTTKYCAGDPKYLEIIKDCVQTRLKIIGALRGDDKAGGTVVNINWGEMYKPRHVDAETVEEDDPIERAIEEAGKRGGDMIVVDSPPAPTDEEE